MFSLIFFSSEAEWRKWCYIRLVGIKYTGIRSHTFPRLQLRSPTLFYLFFLLNLVNFLFPEIKVRRWRQITFFFYQWLYILFHFVQICRGNSSSVRRHDWGLIIRHHDVTGRAGRYVTPTYLAEV